MFDQILQLVKDHFNSNPELAAAIPAGQEDAVHQEIASHIDNHVNGQAAAEPAAGGGLLSSIEGALTSGGTLGNALEGGIIGTLSSKFGLSPAITGAVAAALPGIINKYVNKGNAPAAPTS
jgi:hypothetical protein